MDFAKKIQMMQNEIDRLTVEIVRLAYRITELEAPRQKSAPEDPTVTIKTGGDN
jgi:hypothetical protein